MSDLEELGRFIELRREALGLSKAAASRRAEISNTKWRQVEQGKGATAATLSKMAKALELLPEEVLQLAGRPVHRELVPADLDLTKIAERLELIRAEVGAVVDAVRTLSKNGER